MVTEANTGYQMSVAEVAEVLGTNISDVYDRLNRKIIPSHHSGRRWVILRAEFEQWRNGTKLTAVPSPSKQINLTDLVGYELAVEINGIPLVVKVNGVVRH